MTSEFRRLALKTPYLPVIIFNKYFSLSRRLFINKILFIFSLFLVFSLVLDILLIINPTPFIAVDSLFKILHFLIPLTALIISLKLLFFSLNAFFNSYYLNIDNLFTFKIASIFYDDNDNTLIHSFFKSNLGLKILKRLEINSSEFQEFLKRKERTIFSLAMILDSSRLLTLPDLAEKLFIFDKDLQSFFLGKGINKDDLKKVSLWVNKEEEVIFTQSRWWTRESLELIPSLAQDWSYGHTHTLDQFSTEIKFSRAERSSHFYPLSRRQEIERIISVISRVRESNVILEGDSAPAKFSILNQLATLIEEGNVPKFLVGRRLLLLKSSAILSEFTDNQSLEKIIMDIFEEAILAGNIILAIDDLPVLVMTLKDRGINFLSLISDYLLSPSLQVIVLADKRRFYQDLQSSELIIDRFEKVTISDLDEEETLLLVYETLFSLEKKYGVFFTYPAVSFLIEAASRYFSADESLQDQVLDLVDELISWPSLANYKLIKRENIEDFVSFKTKIPLGQLRVGEREMLLNLESRMQKKIIGQEKGIDLIASALRRARVNISSSTRPIGSFLFLGPTGVGKTETVKVLAEEFFGNKEEILRLDMSEYQSTNALNRLLGSFESNKAGVLSTMIRQHPYGILLLDEFEKTSFEVMNLFLQILDEGFFSDMNGLKINARNLIIIATSNAGSEMVWQLTTEGKNPSEATNEIVNYLVNQGIYRPELLNRFDGVVVFNPLDNISLEKIAELELGKLSEKLRQQGIELKISPGLIKLVADRGHDRRFGARALKRFVQDKLEDSLARARIEGRVQRGSSLELDGEGRLNI